MPNHVLNELVFNDADADEQESIIRALCDNEGKVDFEHLVPSPVNVWAFSVSILHEKAFRQTALEWNAANWGTKWNAYSHAPIERTDTSIMFRFDTAWRPPYGWLCAVFNTLKRDFDHNWIDESGPSGIGAFRWPKKPMDDFRFKPWFERTPTEDEHRRLHKLKWGVEKFTDEDA